MANLQKPRPGERWKKLPCDKHADMPTGIANIPSNFGKHPCAACNARQERMYEMIECGCFVPVRRMKLT